jgi:phage terminase small subunit
MTTRALSPRMKRFVEEYLRTRSGAEAARRAGYSPFNASVTGTQLLRDPRVAAALREAGLDVPPPGARTACGARTAAGLTARQQRFVEHYAILGNAAEAARRAGYAESSAKRAGFDLLRVPRIAAAIAATNTARAERLRLDGDRVLEECARLSYVNLRAFLEERGGALALKPFDDIAPEDWSALAELTVTPTEHGPRVKVKLFDKLRAMTLLAKHFGLLTPPPAPPEDKTDYRALLREKLNRLIPKKTEDETVSPPQPHRQS